MAHRARARARRRRDNDAARHSMRRKTTRPRLTEHMRWSVRHSVDLEEEMLANSLIELDRAHLVHPVSSYRSHEAMGVRVLKSAKGATVTDATGHTLLDGFAGLWCVNAGYGQDSIVEAARSSCASFPTRRAISGWAPSRPFASLRGWPNWRRAISTISTSRSAAPMRSTARSGSSATTIMPRGRRRKTSSFRSSMATTVPRRRGPA